ncbi:MAG: outer membrane lipoprotein carrier protein LolA [Puniceicoccales bacterium]|jgi:hypothetical protein|nr:outer membrane lipoprotein carrier protein LolA [Puniceicoccales bacterium]
MKYAIILFLAFFIGGISLFASPISLDDIQQRLATHAVLRCEFSQQRHIAGLTRPLKASGKILIAQKHGLYWRQIKPFAQTLILQPGRMVQILEGKEPVTITPESNPQLFQFNSLLLAVLNADRAELEKTFTLDLATNQDVWTLTLTPSTPPLDKVFRKIILSGSQHIESVKIEDTQGDATDIRFARHTTTPATLTPAERAQFSQGQLPSSGVSGQPAARGSALPSS